MRKLRTLAALVLTVIGFSMPVALADTYTGWQDEIQPALADGDGDEFVENVGMDSDHFDGLSELEAVQAALTWIASEYDYVSDVGEVWTSASQMYATLEGDCEDWAILLCALLRFHTYGGIPADRVWVAAGHVPGGGLHAWVQYRDPYGSLWNFEPSAGFVNVINLRGAKLRFNDQWVRPLNAVKRWRHP